MNRASIIIVTHNSEAVVRPVLQALARDLEAGHELIVVDSASTDGTRGLLRGHDATVILRDDNLGFAAGCHLGVEASSNQIVVFLGHDTTPDQGWLGPLISAFDDPSVGAAVSTLEASDLPGMFNTSGGRLTYFGIAWMSDQGKPIPPDELGPIDIAFPQGGAMAMTKETWARFGGFRPEFFMYNEDVDLGWRLRLGGLRVVRLPESRVRHDFDFNRSSRKMYHLERNRWLMLRSNYRRRTLVVLAPALIVVELGAALVSIRDGWWRDKRAAFLDASRSGHLVRPGRVLTELNRVLPDSTMIASMDYRLSDISQVKVPRLTVFADAFLRVWQRIAVPLIRLLERLPG